MQHFITSYGVAAVFVLMLAESACIPVPSELIMLLGGALAAGAVAEAHPSLMLYHHRRSGGQRGREQARPSAGQPR